MNVTAIVPSAGTGERMQHSRKKPYINLMGKPILSHTLEVLDRVPSIEHIIILVYAGEEQFCRDAVVDKTALRTEVTVTAGGATRQESVYRGIRHLPKQCDTVLIHDGARPFITPELIRDGLDAVQTQQALTMGVPVKDTITRVSSENLTITETPPRKTLYRVQTPQMFQRDLIEKAHNQALQDGFTGTDDASLVQRLGIPVHMHMGSYDNIKITTPEDLLFAEAILKGRQS